MSLFYADLPYTISASTIDVNADYAESTRTFQKRPRVPVSHDYQSCLFLVTRPRFPDRDVELPRRRGEHYRNHFALYRCCEKDRPEIVLSRVECSRVYQDVDTIVAYDRIGLADARRARGVVKSPRCETNEWRCSFDRDIAYSSNKPRSFLAYEMIASGEWWFFDRGIVLNGSGTFDYLGLPFFAYLELHPKVLLGNVTAATIPAFRALSSSLSSTHRRQGDDALSTAMRYARERTARFVSSPSSRERNGAPRLSCALLDSSVPPETVVPLAVDRGTGAGQPLITTNDNVSATADPFYVAAVPSAYWFEERLLELQSRRIDYFLPENSLDYGQDVVDRSRRSSSC